MKVMILKKNPISAAVPGGDWGKIEKLRICPAASELICSEPNSSHNIAMSRLRIREKHVSSCVGLAPSLNVCTSNSQPYDIHVVLQSRSMMTEKKELLYEPSSITAVIAHRLWAHIGSVPWATTKSTRLPVSVVAWGV